MCNKFSILFRALEYLEASRIHSRVSSNKKWELGNIESVIVRKEIEELQHGSPMLMVNPNAQP